MIREESGISKGVLPPSGWRSRSMQPRHIEGLEKRRAQSLETGGKYFPSDLEKGNLQWYSLSIRLNRKISASILASRLMKRDSADEGTIFQNHKFQVRLV